MRRLPTCCWTRGRTSTGVGGWGGGRAAAGWLGVRGRRMGVGHWEGVLGAGPEAGVQPAACSTTGACTCASSSLIFRPPVGRRLEAHVHASVVEPPRLEPPSNQGYPCPARTALRPALPPLTPPPRWCPQCGQHPQGHPPARGHLPPPAAAHALVVRQGSGCEWGAAPRRAVGRGAQAGTRGGRRGRQPPGWLAGWLSCLEPLGGLLLLVNALRCLLPHAAALPGHRRSTPRTPTAIRPCTSPAC